MSRLTSFTLRKFEKPWQTPTKERLLAKSAKSSAIRYEFLNLKLNGVSFDIAAAFKHKRTKRQSFTHRLPNFLLANLVKSQVGNVEWEFRGNKPRNWQSGKETVWSLSFSLVFFFSICCLEKNVDTTRIPDFFYYVFACLPIFFFIYAKNSLEKNLKIFPIFLFIYFFFKFRKKVGKFEEKKYPAWHPICMEF